MSGESTATWIAASRAASNVPTKVEDEGVLLQVAHMLVAGGRQGEEGGGRRARAS